MSDIIKLLPASVSNQIAAGEVVQRPSSVLKELLENSIDSGASEIKIIVKDSGKTFIQVIDNGCGMTKNDAIMAFERHATSKIKTSNDIFAIKTNGFRGEAMASIASVAQVEMKTKNKADELGTKVVINGSKIISNESIVSKKGTSTLVKNLFYNVPARRNFLKSNSVEYRHILEEFYRIAIAHKDIDISLEHNSKLIFSLKPSSLKERLVKIFGNKINENLVVINEKTSIVSLKGFVTKPQYSKKTRGEQYFFVNNRFIKSNYLNHAIKLAFRGLIQQGYNVSYFIFIEVDPKKIDINIHPTKTEIKFEDESSIYNILLSSVKHSLGMFNITSTLDFDQNPDLDVSFMRKSPVVEPQINIDSSFNPFKTESYISKNNTHQGLENINIEISQTVDNHIDKTLFETQKTYVYLQIHKQYIVCNNENGMMLISQNRAHQRVLYERYLKMLSRENYIIQKLLFPVRFLLSAMDLEILKSIDSHLPKLGFEIKYNDLEVEVSGAPVEINPSKIRETLDNIISQVRESNQFEEHFSKDIAKVLAKNSAVKKGDTLSQDKIESLVKDLFLCENVNYSPYGKKIFEEFDLDKLNSIFE